MDGNIVFEEEQRFTQWWLWLLLGGILLIPIYGIIQQIGFNQPFGNNPMSDLGLFIFLIGMLAFCGFFWWMRMQTTVTKEKIMIKFSPLANKQILWSDVKEAQLVTYKSIVGYGLRFSTTYGTVYNVKGNRGLSLILKNGKKYMVGTQCHRELGDIIPGLLK